MSMTADEKAWRMSDVLRRETAVAISSAARRPGADVRGMLWAVSIASHSAGLIAGMGAGMGGPGRMEVLGRWYVQACRELANISAA